MKNISRILSIIILFIITSSVFTEENTNNVPEHNQNLAQKNDESCTLHLSLEDCIDIALENNRFHSASQYAVKIAEAQHKQALSTFWPRLNISAAFTLMDEDPNFIFPSSELKIPEMMMTIPKDFLFPGFPAEPTDIPVPKQSFTIPEQRITLMDKVNSLSSLNLSYPFYTGGKISAIRKQAKSAVEIAKEEARRTDLKIIYDVKRFYYAAVLAREIHEISKIGLTRLEATLELTESLYLRGSGRVKKTDYLKNKIIVDNVRSFVGVLKNKEKLAKAALINTLGLDWQTSVELSAKEIPYIPYPTDVKKFISGTYCFNPDLAKLKATLKVFEAKLSEAKSGHFPKVALMGTLNHIENSYNYGMATSENKDMWTIGVGLKLPIFSGMQTRNQVKEARARLDRLEEQQILLRDGLALHIQHIFLQMTTAQEQQKVIKDALNSAEENRDLTERAYQHEILEEKDLIEAQIIESLMKAQYQKVVYDHIETQAHLDFILGAEILNILTVD